MGGVEDFDGELEVLDVQLGTVEVEQAIVLHLCGTFLPESVEERTDPCGVADEEAHGHVRGRDDHGAELECDGGVRVESHGAGDSADASEVQESVGGAMGLRLVHDEVSVLRRVDLPEVVVVGRSEENGLSDDSSGGDLAEFCGLDGSEARERHGRRESFDLGVEGVEGLDVRDVIGNAVHSIRSVRSDPTVSDGGIKFLIFRIRKVRPGQDIHMFEAPDGNMVSDEVPWAEEDEVRDAFVEPEVDDVFAWFAVVADVHDVLAGCPIGRGAPCEGIGKDVTGSKEGHVGSACTFGSGGPMNDHFHEVRFGVEAEPPRVEAAMVHDESCAFVHSFCSAYPHNPLNLARSVRGPCGSFGRV